MKAPLQSVLVVSLVLAALILVVIALEAEYMDPKRSCAWHGGVQRTYGSKMRTTGVVCRDGYSERLK